MGDSPADLCGVVHTVHQNAERSQEAVMWGRSNKFLMT